MSESKYRVRVPGKLFIAGEYAVLEPDQQAIVVAVNRYITATIESSENNVLALPEIGFEQVCWTRAGNQVNFDITDPKLTFVQNAIKIVDQFLQEYGVDQKYMSISISSELDDSSGRKYGLGSSAAIVVAVVSSMLHWYRDQIKVTEELIFKLSAIAHLQTQGNGSGADVAASTYGGWLCYAAFQPSWIHAQLRNGITIKDLLHTSWPYLYISRKKPPNGLSLRVGWTGAVAETGPMVKQIQALREQKPKLYDQFLADSSNAVGRLVKSFESNDNIEAIASLSENREALIKLGEPAGVPIETGDLSKLATIAERYGSGKSSGAGGGDCGIAFVKGQVNVNQLARAWQEEGITPLDLKVSPHGVIVEAV